MVLTLAILWIYFRYTAFFDLAPHQVIEPWGDGIKAYTVIEYHAKHDSTYAHFAGMNYPYGELAVPAATQPFFSFSLKLLAHFGIDFSNYTVVIVNLGMLLGILLSVLFLFLILEQLRLPFWASIPTALFITILAPQTHRLAFHYGLAHVEVLPILIYLLLRYDQSRQLKWSCWIMLMVILSAGIHFYFFALLAISISAYFLFDGLFHLNWTSFKSAVKHYSIQVGIPFLIFFYWIILSDSISDRCSLPWGFFIYKTSIQDTFISLSQPHFQFIDQHLFKFKQTDFEQKNYIGLIATIFLFFMVVRWGIQRFRHTLLSNLPSHQTFLLKLFLASGLVYGFSLGLPFTLPGLDGWLAYAGPLKQFRSLGRFAWFFYFTINIISIAGIFYLSKKPLYQITLMVCTMFVLGFEAYHFTYEPLQVYSLNEIPEWKTSNYFQQETGIDFDRFQAILPIPYYNIGSDHFWEKPYNVGFSLQKSLLLSLETGLPVTGAMLTRTSLSQTINQLQLVKTPYRKPKILEAYPNQKPLLLLIDKTRFAEHKQLNPHFENAGTLLYEAGDLQLYELPLNSFQKRITQRIDTIQMKLDTTQTYKDGPFLATDSLLPYFYNAYDDQSNDFRYLGAGGRKIQLNNVETIYQEQEVRFPAKEPLHISFWIYINQDLVSRSALTVTEKSQEGTTNSHSSKLHDLISIFDNHGWALVEFSFTKQTLDGEIEITLENKFLRPNQILMDELLIRPERLDLFRQTDRILWYNNQYFNLPIK